MGWYIVRYTAAVFVPVDINSVYVVSTATVVCEGVGQEWSDRCRQHHTFTDTTNSRSVVVVSTILTQISTCTVYYIGTETKCIGFI